MTERWYLVSCGAFALATSRWVASLLGRPIIRKVRTNVFDFFEELARTEVDRTTTMLENEMKFRTLHFEYSRALQSDLRNRLYICTATRSPSSAALRLRHSLHPLLPYARQFRLCRSLPARWSRAWCASAFLRTQSLLRHSDYRLNLKATSAVTARSANMGVH